MSPEILSSSTSIISAIASSLGLDAEHLGMFNHAAHAMDSFGVAEVAAHPTEVALEPIHPVVIHELGGPHAVSHPGNGKTAIENGFTDTTDNGIDDSPIEKSAAEVAKKLGMSPEQTKDFLAQVHKHKDEFIAASKVTGYNKDGIRDVLIQKGDAVMGTSNGAQDVILDLNRPEQAVTTVITLADGTKVDFAVWDKCGNPMLTAHQGAPVVVPPVEATKPVEAVKNPYQIYDAKVNCETGCKAQLATVTRDGLPAGSVWTDENGNGQYWKEQRVPGSADHMAKEIVLDRHEFHPPDQATVDRDVAELRRQGFMGNTVVYNLTDTEGKNVVVCYNVKTHAWDLFTTHHTDDEVRATGHLKDHLVLDSKTLAIDLSTEKKH